jgi:predicted transcriptional regulator
LVTNQEKEKKEEKAERKFAEKNSTSPERYRSDTDNLENRGNHSTVHEIENLGYNENLFAKMIEVFDAGLANATRVKMLIYCLKERSFTDIMLTLRLNPASLKHHQDLLRTTGLIKKTGKGKNTKYKTTELGRILLRLMETVQRAIKMG